MAAPWVQSTIDSGLVKLVWVDMIKRALDLSCFRIVHRYHWEFEGERDVGPTPDQSLSLSLDTIVASGRRPVKLDISHDMSQRRVWTEYVQWEQLNLTELTSLVYSSTRAPWKSKEEVDIMSRETKLLCDWILLNAKKTLKKLTIRGTTSLTLLEKPDTVISPLQNIQDLTFDGGLTGLTPLLAWLSERSSLQKLTLRCFTLKLDDHPERWYHMIDRWKPLFSSFRDHSNRPLVRIVGLSLFPEYYNSQPHVSLDQQVGNRVTVQDPLPSDQNQWHPNNTIPLHIARMLRNYLAGASEWQVKDNWRPDYDCRPYSPEEYDPSMGV